MHAMHVQLQKFLETVEEEGGSVEDAFDEDGNVLVLFVSFQAMRKTFIESTCRTVQIDTSFDFESSKYKLCGFCYLNPATNDSEFCALASLDDETVMNLRIAFKFFKKLCSHVLPQVIIVNKDFTEITALQKVFRTARIFCVISMSSNKFKI